MMPAATISVSTRIGAPAASAARPGLRRAGAEGKIGDDLRIAAGVDQADRDRIHVGRDGGEIGLGANGRE